MKRSDACWLPFKGRSKGGRSASWMFLPFPQAWCDSIANQVEESLSTVSVLKAGDALSPYYADLIRGYH